MWGRLGETEEGLSVLPSGTGSMSELTGTDVVPAERAGLEPACPCIPRGSPAWPVGGTVETDTREETEIGFVESV